MKLLNKTDDKFVFELDFKEKELLVEVLKLYPVLDPAYQKLSDSLDEEEISLSRKILKEDLLEHQEKNRQMVDEIFGEGSPFKRDALHCNLELGAEQLECLLQVLNDIRVGTWRNLDSPGYDELEKLRLEKSDVVPLVVMDVCEYFEYHFLDAIGL